MKKIVFFTLMFLLTVGLSAQNTYYVSKKTGSNRNDGSKGKPYKNLQKAMNVAQKGDKIMVAEGNYYGLLNKGSLEVKKAIEIYGGYSQDFSSRDVVKHQSMISPPASTNGTAANAGVFYIDVKDNQPGKLIIDGIIFDKSNSNGYHPTKGKPSGVESGMYMEPPLKGANDVISKRTKLLGGSFNKGTVIIRNCVFNNGDNYAIQLGVNDAEVKVLNNVFTANLFAAAEIWGKSSNRKAASVEFAHNTVLFNWCRTKAMEDMGYGFRCMTGIRINVHHNVIGLSCIAGIDRTRDESSQEIKIDNNMFFMNKQADLLLPGSGKFLRIYVDMFDDVEVLTSSSNNAELSPEAGKTLKTALNIPYLEGFLAAAYTESTDYDPSSPMNQARRALGLNQVGKINSSVSMYGNRYLLKDAVKLFGAVKGYGAQNIK